MENRKRIILSGPPRVGFYGSGLASLHAGWGWWMQAESVPSDQKFSCKWNLSFFKAVPSNRLSFLLGSPLHIISSLFSHFCLFQNAVLQKILKLGFLSLVLVISLSWYLHLTVSHEFLTFISFDIWR